MKTFRKIMLAVCAASAAASCMTPFASSAADVRTASTTVTRMGDVNADLHVNADDANEVLGIYLDGMMDRTVITTNKDNVPADVNMDGQIDADDSGMILSYYLKDMMGDKPLWADLRESATITAFPGDIHSSGDADVDSLLGITAAGKDFYVEVGCAEGKPGDEVTVPVYIAGAHQLTAFQYFMSAPESLEISNIECKISNTLVSTWDGDQTTYSGVDCEVPDCFMTDNPERMSYDGHPNAVINLASDVGGFVWMNANAEPTSFEDGTIIGEYTFKIPESAKSGDNILLNPTHSDNTYCLFVSTDDEEAISRYDYTFLGGVVAVK